MDGSSFVGLGAGAALCGKAFMVSAGMSEDEFHAKVAACLEEEDAAMKEEDAAKRGDEDVEIVETDAGAYIFSFLYN